MSFNIDGLVPKSDTRADVFVKENPDCDGRRSIVAIFDTGVDPAAPGLQLTSDGKPKIVDIVDATGSGDVDMSTQRTLAAGQHTLTGLTGRTLTIPQGWANPTGVFRLGLKRAFELMPHGLVHRMSSEVRKPIDKLVERTTAAAQNQNVNGDGDASGDATAALDTVGSFVKSDSDVCGAVYDCLVWHDGAHWRACVDTSECGDLAACPAPMTNFAVERQYATFGDVDLLTYSVNIYDEGETLSIVTNAGAHGTHVAAIVAAYHKDVPERNGVAPGAQIVAVKIGDSRLGSMETGVGLVRGLAHAVRAGCDIVNMSYGEGTRSPEDGFFSKQIRQAVLQHNLVFVSSAGNNGCALSTSGCPGGSDSMCIGVGAYAAPSIMESGYSMRDSVPGCQYTWSSRAPAINGTHNVTITAPGGAITSVPPWTLRPSQLMNGTSMSSPHAAGCVALMVFAAKHRGIPWTPHSVRRALQETAAPIAGTTPWAVGRGLIDVHEAVVALCERIKDHLHYEVTVARNGMAGRGVYLRERHETHASETVHVRVAPVFTDATPAATKAAFERRIVMTSSVEWVVAPRNLVLVTDGREFAIEVKPGALAHGSGAHYGEIVGKDADTSEMLFIVPVTVIRARTESDAVTIDTTLGTSAIHREFLPVPESATWAEITVTTHPPSAAAATTTTTTTTTLAQASSVDGGDDNSTDESDQSTLRMMVHTLQLVPGMSFHDTEMKKYLSLSRTGGSETLRTSVHGGHVMELALGRWWANLGDACRVTATVRFHGVRTATNGAMGLHLQSSVAATRVEVFSPLRACSLEFTGYLQAWRQPLRPDTADLRAMVGTRDVVLDDTPTYMLHLSYSFTQTESGSVLPILPVFSDLLYESSFWAQMWTIYDKSKRLCATGDAFPFNYKGASTRLAAGDYELHVILRHASRAALDKLQHTTVQLHRELSKEISLSAYKTENGALSGSDSFSVRSLLRNQSAALFVAPPSTSQLPSGCTPGCSLEGWCTFMKRPTSSAGAVDGKSGALTKRPVGADSVRLHVDIAHVKKGAAKKKGDKSGSGDETTKSESMRLVTSAGEVAETEAEVTATVMEHTDKFLLACGYMGVEAEFPDDERAAVGDDEIVEVVRDAQVAWLRKNRTGAGKRGVWLALYWKLVCLHPRHLPLLCEGLRFAEALKSSEAETDARTAVLAAGDAVLAVIDRRQLAEYFGVLTPEGGDATPEGKQRTAERDAVVEALHAQAKTHLARKSDTSIGGSVDTAADSAVAFEGTLRELKKWCKMTDARTLVLHLRSEEAHGHFASVLKELDKSSSASTLEAQLSRKEILLWKIRLMEKLGWNELVANEKAWLPFRCRETLPRLY